jgi:uncharacterized protein
MEKVNLIIFARRPEISIGKSRLKKKIGKTLGSNFYYNNLLKTIVKINADKRINLKLCVTPDNALHNWSNLVFPKIIRIPQGPGDIGEKMWRVFSKNSKKTIIIGSDIPDITNKIILHAWKKLHSSNIVFGPAKDGGFWLIGISQSKKLEGLFKNINWSQRNTLKQVKKNIPSSEKISFVETLRDID